MKAITPIVSVVLIILLTIFAGATAFFFISSAQEKLSSNIDVKNSEFFDDSNIALISITGSKVVLINSGSSKITELIVRINNELLEYELNGSISPNSLIEITYPTKPAGEALDIEIIYNKNKHFSIFSAAEKNTESNGFYSTLDNNEQDCRNGGYVWFTQETTGEGGSCCGNNGIYDNFFKGNLATTNTFCLNGVYVKENLDTHQALCNNYNYLWFSGENNGDNYSCCGDDGALDNFYNNTIGLSEHFCIAGEFVESTLDANEELCLNNGFDWVYGLTSGSNYSCCGDDEVNDNFSNSTHECINGVLEEKPSIIVIFEDLSDFDYKTIQGANWEQWSPLTEFTPAPSGWWGRAHDDQGLVKLTDTYRNISPLGDSKMFYIEVNPYDQGWVYGAEIYRNLTVELDSFDILNLSFYHAWFDDELIYAGVDKRWYQWNFYIDTNNDFVLNTSDEYYQWVPNDGNFNNNLLKLDIGYPSNSVELVNGVWEFINLDILSAFYSKYGHYPTTSTGIMKFGFAAGKSCSGCGDTGYIYAFFDNITLSYK